MAKQTRIEQLRNTAAGMGLYVATHSPGDGVTRYRFMKSRGGKPISYFRTDGIYTALGMKEAKMFLMAYNKRR